MRRILCCAPGGEIRKKSGINGQIHARKPNRGEADYAQ